MGRNFRRKTRFVTDGHKTKTPAAMIYFSVVSMDSVWIVLTITSLNGLYMLAWDIQNAYLMADCIDQIWVVARTEFGSKAGKNMLARKNLY